MCLTYMYLNRNGKGKYKLIVAFNRDCSVKRKSKQLGFWEDDPNILAGRDARLGT